MAAGFSESLSNTSPCHWRQAATLLAAAMLCAACGGGGSDVVSRSPPPMPQPTTPTPPPTIPPPSTPPPATPPSAGNEAPTIAGTPLPSILQGAEYIFVPAAEDANSDTLTFSVENLPSWASFDPSTGRLSGTPEQEHVGAYAGIEIRVTDGAAQASLGAFSIDVVATAVGSATLSWTAPTQRSDGTPLDALAGFKIYWGPAEGSYTTWATISNPSVTTYTVEQLTPATWYFVATAFDEQGVESTFSSVASKTIL